MSAADKLEALELQIAESDQEDLDALMALEESRVALIDQVIEEEAAALDALTEEPPPSDFTFDEPPMVDDDGELTVEFTDRHVVLTSTVDKKVRLTGDIRDSTVRLRAGQETRRRLTAEGNGYVAVDGIQYPTEGAK